MKKLPWFVSIKGYTLPNYIDIHGEYSIIRYQKDSFMNQIRILWFGSRKWVVLPYRFFADFFGVFLEVRYTFRWFLMPWDLKIPAANKGFFQGFDEKSWVVTSEPASWVPGLVDPSADLPWGLPWESKSRMWCMQCTRFMRWEGIFQINDWEEVWTMRIRYEAWVFWKGIGKMWYF